MSVQISKKIIFILLLILSSQADFAIAQPGGEQYKNQPLEARVERLERLTNAQKKLDLLYRVKQLQQENQQLRGFLEEQNNEIRILKEQQKERYADLNRRLSQIETAGDSSHESNDTSGLGTAEQPKTIVEHQALPVVAVKNMSNKDRQVEQKLYQQAYAELMARRYNKARESFLLLIEKYPAGRYAHLAQYWIAEASYIQRDYEQAIVDYQLLLDSYPSSPKKAEAGLKKAYSYYYRGNNKSARYTLNQLLINYPNTTEAGQARSLLKQL